MEGRPLASDQAAKSSAPRVELPLPISTALLPQPTAHAGLQLPPDAERALSDLNSHQFVERQRATATLKEKPAFIETYLLAAVDPEAPRDRRDRLIEIIASSVVEAVEDIRSSERKTSVVKVMQTIAHNPEVTPDRKLEQLRAVCREQTQITNANRLCAWFEAFAESHGINLQPADEAARATLDSLPSSLFPEPHRQRYLFSEQQRLTPRELVNAELAKTFSAPEKTAAALGLVQAIELSAQDPGFGQRLIELKSKSSGENPLPPSVEGRYKQWHAESAATSLFLGLAHVQLLAQSTARETLSALERKLVESLDSALSARDSRSAYATAELAGAYFEMKSSRARIKDWIASEPPESYQDIERQVVDAILRSDPTAARRNAETLKEVELYTSFVAAHGVANANDVHSIVLELREPNL